MSAWEHFLKDTFESPEAIHEIQTLLGGALMASPSPYAPRQRPAPAKGGCRGVRS